MDNLNNVVDASLTIEHALEKARSELNVLLVSFDRWATLNPQMLNPENAEFRLYKHQVKVMRLKINELQEMKDAYNNTVVMVSKPEFLEDEVEFSKSRNSDVFTANLTMKVGGKKGNRVSKG